jgi:hypothetical protein
MKRRRKYRRNAVTSDDLLHLIFAGVAGVALGLIMGRKSSNSTSGIGEFFRSPMNGLGAYFHDPVNLPVSGLGNNYVRVR